MSFNISDETATRMAFNYGPLFDNRYDGIYRLVGRSRGGDPLAGQQLDQMKAELAEELDSRGLLRDQLSAEERFEYSRKTQEMVLDAHDKAFAFFGGACVPGIYDSEAWPPWVRGQAERRSRWTRSSSAAIAPILGAILIDGHDDVEAACAEAVSEGVHSADVILNILARRHEPEPPKNITTPMR